MTATHAREEESQENRISNKDFQRRKENFQSNGLITMKQKLNPQMMMMMMKNSTTSTTAQSNFDRCFSNQLKKFTEIDQTSSEGSGSGSESSTEEEEEEYSPKSVKEFGLKRFVHHQVLKIKEEDSHIGEDYIKEITLIHHLTSQQVRALILPSSPLSGKSSIKSFH